MILDKENLFSSEQALTSTGASTNLIDLSQDRNVGQGEALAVLLVLDVAADDTTGDETYSVAVETDDNSSFSSATTIDTITITRGDAAGTRYVSVLPPLENMERYLRLNATLGGTSPSVTFSAYFVPRNFIDAYYSYPNGYTIS